MTKWVDPIQLDRGADSVSDEADGGRDDASAVPALGSTGDGSSGDGSSGDANGSGNSGTKVVVASEGVTSFPIILALAFLGGLILNVMPCVLPVVGLKIMGFVKQAGEDRSRVLVLNLVYVLGIMSVFAVFAVVAAVSKFGWGEQFTYFPVRLTLTLMLFALALSYLDVWEIPVPGMAGGKASQELQNREGLAGAFSKGVFATILATPCSGPLLGYILGLTLNLSAAHTIAIFLTVGLGMSLPYLIIGFKPSLVSWLPKPGPWMDKVKQLMAFLFLGTVAFFFAQFQDDQKVPVFVSLIAVWFGCWIIGQVPNWAELQKRLLAWVGGIAAATLISVWAFSYLKPDYELAWEDYSEPRLQQLQQEGRTVLVDFGAKWCLTCLTNYEVAINTPRTREVLDELDGVALYADWTDYDEEIKNKLEELNSRSIPLLAIYPGSRPNQPIILRDIVTQEAVVEALRQAGASVDRTSMGLGSSRPAIASTSN
jgi:thiol:disulfide interchange protein